MADRRKKPPFTIIIPASEVEVFFCVVILGIKLIYFENDDNGTVFSFFESETDELIDVRQVSNPWRLFFTNLDNEDSVNAAHLYIESQVGPLVEPPVLIESRNVTEGVTLATAQFVIEEYSEIINHYAESLLIQADLRARHEDVQNRFAELEIYLQKIGVSPTSLVFENLPAEAQVFTLQGSETLCQMLPISSQSISLLQLNFPGLNLSQADKERLRIKIETLEDKHSLADVTLDKAEPIDGWSSIYVTSRPDFVSRSTNLIIHNTGRKSITISLGVGKQQPMDDYRPKISQAQGAISQSSLALRCWHSLTGAEGAKISSGTKFIDEKYEMDVAISADKLNKFLHFYTNWQPDFNPVKFHIGEGAVECHPPVRGVTIGYLKMNSTGVKSRISASCLIKGQASENISFQIAVLNQDQFNVMKTSYEIFWNNEENEAFTSGWITLSVNEMSRLSVMHDSCNSETIIIIMTRMAVEGQNSHAWARFSHFSITPLS